MQKGTGGQVTGVQSMLAEGTYGCAFYPALPCKKGVKKNTEREKKVSKLTRIVNSELELEAAAALRTIPAWKQYYIVSYEDECSRRELEQFYKEYKSRCEFLERVSSSQLIQLVSPYGGIDINKYNFPDSFSVLGYLKHLAKGIALMHEIGFGHFDIHEKNILIDGKGVARLIDFGKSMKGDTVDTEKIQKHTFTFTPSFIWQPPELAVMNAVQEGQTSGRSIERVMEQKGIFREIQSILGISIRQQEGELREFWNFSHSAQSRAWDTFFRHYWRKFDVWALGVVTLSLVTQMLIRSRFVQGIWQKESDTLVHVLRGMLHADPRRRFTIEKVVELLSTTGPVPAPGSVPAAELRS